MCVFTFIYQTSKQEFSPKSWSVILLKANMSAEIGLIVYKLSCATGTSLKREPLGA